MTSLQNSANNFFKKYSKESIYIVAAIVITVALTGGLFTNVGTWYDNLPKIALQPPKWVFGPVWTILYTLIGASAVIIANAKNAKSNERNVALFTFGLNGFFNAFWCFLFFMLQNVDKAFIGIVALWITILLMICFASKVSKKAAWLLVPYIVWVSFAMYLNGAYMMAR